jgi:hypothetical protein
VRGHQLGRYLPRGFEVLAELAGRIVLILGRIAGLALAHGP